MWDSRLIGVLQQALSMMLEGMRAGRSLGLGRREGKGLGGGGGAGGKEERLAPAELFPKLGRW